MDTPNLHNNHNVYILGAGFSADAGLPMIANFMSVMRTAATWYGEQGGVREHDAITKVLDYRLRAAAAAYRCPIDPDNIEDLFSLVDAEEQHRPDAAGPQRQMRLAIAATLDHAHQIYRNDQQCLKVYLEGTDRPQARPSWPQDPANEKHYHVPLYDAYLATMTGYFYPQVAPRRDTIITFNYDTLVEDALSNLETPYSYGFGADAFYTKERPGGFVIYNEHDIPFLRPATGQKGVVDLLKLHGSVNWLLDYATPTEAPTQSQQRLQIFPAFSDLLTEYADPLGRIFIEPPTWRKGHNGGMASVWDSALQALRTASRIIVMGYSMPPTDVHFRYLVAAGLRENISLQEIVFVNPAFAEEALGYKEMVSRTFQVFRPELRDRNTIQFFGQSTKTTLVPLGIMNVIPTVETSVFRKLNPHVGNRHSPFQGRA